MANSKEGSVWAMSAGQLRAAETKLWEELDADGQRAVLRINRDELFLKSLADFIRQNIHGCNSATAAAWLGSDNYFGIVDWRVHYDAKFTKKQQRLAGKFPWGEDVLNSPCLFNSGKRVKDTHFAFLGISGLNGQPLTVAKLLELHPVTGQPRFFFHSDPWHVDQPHTDVTTMQFRWYLLLKDIVPGSTDKTFADQVAMLPPEYEQPSTIVETSKDILVFKKTGERPNGSRWAVCAERTVKSALVSAGFVSCVGRFGEYGLDVRYWSGDRSCHVGLGASRKLPV